MSIMCGKRGTTTAMRATRTRPPTSKVTTITAESGGKSPDLGHAVDELRRCCAEYRLALLFGHGQRAAAVRLKHALDAVYSCVSWAAAVVLAFVPLTYS